MKQHLSLQISRRKCLHGLCASVVSANILSGCTRQETSTESLPRKFSVNRDYSGEEYRVMRVQRSKFDQRLHPHIVASQFRYAPGTIIVDSANNYLYLQRPNELAFRYGVGVGRRGLAWSGSARVALKRKWPSWNPTPRMRAQEPNLPAYVEPGNHNPLGARALYLYSNGVDTLYRIHGTSEPWTIGTRASSGCIRMINEDIIDLYDRAEINSSVIVL